MKNIYAATIIGAGLVFSNACAMEQDDMGKRGWALQQGKVQLTNVPSHLQGKSQGELLKLVSSPLDAMKPTNAELTEYTLDMSQLQTIQAPETKTRAFFTRVVPVGIALGVGYFIAKKMNASEINN